MLGDAQGALSGGLPHKQARGDARGMQEAGPGQQVVATGAPLRRPGAAVNDGPPTTVAQRISQLMGTAKASRRVGDVPPVEQAMPAPVRDCRGSTSGARRMATFVPPSAEVPAKRIHFIMGNTHAQVPPTYIDTHTQTSHMSHIRMHACMRTSVLSLRGRRPPRC